jgi:uncharacterized protein YlxP (DUF503 family)
MTILNGYIDMKMAFVSSLKGRRAILNAIKEKLKKFNISQLDVSGEYPKEASVAIIMLTANETQAQQQIQKIESVLERSFPEVEFEISYELS